MLNQKKMLKNKSIASEIHDVLEGEDLFLDEVKDNSPYSNIRNQNKSEMLEDYVEAIQDILKNKGDVKNGDLAQHFGVSQATVNKNLKRLISFKLAKSEPYRSIFLTEKGEKLATQSKQKHEIVYNFLIKLGVSRKTAENDSEGIEHHVSEETLKLMKKFSE
jgi:DtxR family manganese transport transcriptional regulator